MKTTTLLFLLLGSFLLKGQVLIDSIMETGPYNQIHTFPGAEGKPDNIYVSHIDDQTADMFLLRFNKNLQLLDTLTGINAGRPGGRFIYPFYFNGALYYYCIDSLGSPDRNISIHELENGIFTDSIELNLDTISNSYPTITTPIDNNTLQIQIGKYAANGMFQSSRILYLDSNFQFKGYYNPPLDSIPPTWLAKEIRAIHQLNDSTWHLFYTNTLAIYNPKSNYITSVKKFVSNIYNTYKLPNQTYLALGLTTIPLKPPMVATNTASSLGFYIINDQGNAIDTIQFNAFKDTVPYLGINNYSDEGLGSNVRNSIVYDTNNIFLASKGSYAPYNTNNDFRYFHIVKTDVKGTLKWQFIWGGEGNSVILTGIGPTHDKGCVISGSMRRGSTWSSILIKFGPDGNISNVELDAPENLVEFYPNPVKNKLMYRYLPEAGESYHLEIIDMNGRPVMEANLTDHENSIPVDLKPGFYIYHLKDQAGKVQQVGKLVAE